MLGQRCCAAVLAIWIILALQDKVDGEILGPGKKDDGRGFVARNSGTLTEGNIEKIYKDQQRLGSSGVPGPSDTRGAEIDLGTRWSRIRKDLRNEKAHEPDDPSSKGLNSDGDRLPKNADAKENNEITRLEAKVREDIDREKMNARGIRPRGNEEGLDFGRDDERASNLPKIGRERETLIESGEPSLDRKSFVPENKKAHISVEAGGGVKKLEDIRRCAKRSGMVVSNVKSQVFEGFDKEVKRDEGFLLNSKTGEKDSLDFATAVAEAFLDPEEQPTTESFNDPSDGPYTESDSLGGSGNPREVESTAWPRTTDRQAVRIEAEVKRDDDSIVKKSNHPISRESYTSISDGVGGGRDADSRETIDPVGKTKFNKELPIGLAAVNYAGYIEAEHRDSNAGGKSNPGYQTQESSRGTDVAGDMRRDGEALAHPGAGSRRVQIRDSTIRQIGVSYAAEIGLVQSRIERSRTGSTPQTESHANLSGRVVREDSKPRLITDELLKISSKGIHPRGRIHESTRRPCSIGYVNNEATNTVEKRRGTILGSGNGNEPRIIETLDAGGKEMIGENGGREKMTTPNIRVSSSSAENNQQSERVWDIQAGKSSAEENAPSELSDETNPPIVIEAKDRSTRYGIRNFSANQSGGDTEMTESRGTGKNDDVEGAGTIDPREKSGGNIFSKCLEEGKVICEEKFITENSGTLREKVNRGESSMSLVNKIEDDKNMKVKDTGESLDVVGEDVSLLQASDTTESGDTNTVENLTSTTGLGDQNGVTEGSNFTVNLPVSNNVDGDSREREKGRVPWTTKGHETNLSDELSEGKTKVAKLSALDITRYEFLTDKYFGVDGKLNDQPAQLSGKIVPKVVGYDQTPPYNHRENISPQYSNDAEGITSISLIARLSDTYLSSKNKRAMESQGMESEGEFGGDKTIEELVDVEITTVPDVPNLENEARESPNVLSQEILIALNKSETRTDAGSIFSPGKSTGGRKKPITKVTEIKTRLFSRSFTSHDEVGTRPKNVGQLEELFLANGKNEEDNRDHGSPGTRREDSSRSENSTETNLPSQNKSPVFAAAIKNPTASDEPRQTITAQSHQTRSNDSNESAIVSPKVILEASAPSNPDATNQDILSSLVEKLLSTETPLKTTAEIIQAITQSPSPTFNFNQTNSENSSRVSNPSNQWPVKHSAVVEGDLVLGGLMMVHEREDSVTCGPVMPQGGVQALEAMLYTLDRFNEAKIIPGVKIGAHILDDCDKDTYGLEMAVDFIKGSISNIDGAEYHCNKTAVRKVISGVVGAASSVTSIQVANLLRLFRIPQVSFFSTSPELSNKQRFEYFTRTIPSDHYQVKAMVDIVRKMNWSYVSIIYEESNYGIKAFEELEELLDKYNICIAIKERLVKDSGIAEESAYDYIVQKLLTKPRARGCIVFGSDQEVARVMRAVRRCNATGAFSWIGSDGWSARGLVSNGNEPEVEGTLSVQPQANPVKGFEKYFLDLTVENNRRNPWFVEFWEDHFQCRYPNASWTPHNQNYTRTCTTNERLMKNNTAFEDQLQFVSDAVMAFAYALRNMHHDLCGNKSGLCDAMKPTKGTELLKYLRNVTFKGLSGDEFKFDKNGDGPARYNIIHFKQVSRGTYKWIRVGEYMEGELRLNMSDIQFRLAHPTPPESVCSLPCEVGQAKKLVEGESCCWHCFNCTPYQVRHPLDETQCIPCPQGSLPDETHSNCREIPEEFLRPESGWAIGAMSFSATGILVTLFVGGVFLRHNDTPVVRASGRELSYVLLTGILLCYLVTFALVLRPNNIVCGIQRFGAGFCFTVVYAALLTKTNRISRIFNAGKQSAKRPSFISPRSQLIICSGLMGVQILVNGVWMIIDPAKAMHHYPTREDNLLVCNSYIDASYMIAFTYPIILIVVCTVYAVLTRKIPEAFNESKHIGFTMYTTCVIWLAFVPLYFGTGNQVALRITSMSVTISLSASVTIACLFSPKLYIILIRPERNVRQSMMPARYNTTKSSAVTGTNASSMMATVTLTAVTCDQNKAVKRHVTPTIDCSTQSEHYEMEVKEDRSNGKAPGNFVSRSTQTPPTEPESKSTGGAKDSVTTSKDIVKDSNMHENKHQLNNARIGNGPVSQKDGQL